VLATTTGTGAPIGVVGAVGPGRQALPLADGVAGAVVVGLAGSDGFAEYVIGSMEIVRGTYVAVEVCGTAFGCPIARTSARIASNSRLIERSWMSEARACSIRLAVMSSCAFLECATIALCRFCEMPLTLRPKIVSIC
jgi:hypothetical protein